MHGPLLGSPETAAALPQPSRTRRATGADGTTSGVCRTLVFCFFFFLGGGGGSWVGVVVSSWGVGEIT